MARHSAMARAAALLIAPHEWGLLPDTVERTTAAELSDLGIIEMGIHEENARIFWRLAPHLRKEKERSNGIESPCL